MGVDYPLCFVLCASTLVLSWLAKVLQGSWLSPGSVAGLTWFVAGAVPLAIAPELPAHVSAYFFGFSFALISVLGSTAGYLGLQGNGMLRPQIRRECPRSSSWYYALVLIGAVSPVLIFVEAREFVGSASLGELPLEVSRARYGAEFLVSLVARLPLIAGFVAASLGGFAFGASPTGERHFLRNVLWVIPLILASFIHTARAAVLMALVFWLAGACAGLRFSGRDMAVRLRTLSGWAIVSGLLVAMLGVVTQALRMGRLAASDLPDVVGHLRVYLVGHMPLLGYWLDTELGRHQEVALGVRTFAGVAEWLGAADRTIGLYSGLGYVTDSNIYTAARPLIEDFTIGGSAILGFVFAFAAGISWAAVGRGRIAASPAVVVYVAFVLWSPITSLFAYNLPIVALAVYALWAVRGGRPRNWRLARQGQTAIVIGFFVAGLPRLLEAAEGTDPSAKSRRTGYFVTDFGADPEGRKDSTGAIQTAIRELCSGCTLVFPTGVYRASNLVLEDRRDVTLRGHGALIHWMGIADEGRRIGLELRGTLSGVTVDGLSFVGDGTVGGRHAGIYATRGSWLSDLSIVRNSIRDVTLGISINSERQGSAQRIRIAENEIENVVGVDPGFGYGIHVAVQEHIPAAIEIVRNRLEATQRHAIYQARGVGTVIAGNVVRRHRASFSLNGSIRAGISVARSRDVVVQKNIVRQTSGGALYIGTEPGADSVGIRVVGNVFAEPWDGVPALVIGSQDPVAEGAPRQIEVHGNDFFCAGPEGVSAIRLYAGHDVVIRENRFWVSAARHAIVAYALGERRYPGKFSSRWIVSDNVVFGGDLHGALVVRVADAQNATLDLVEMRNHSSARPPGPGSRRKRRCA